MSTVAPVPGAIPAPGRDARAIVQPWWLRLFHWINVIAVLALIFSGWRIYDASPIFPFKFPKDITLGGWLGGALLWHFAAMWLLFANGIAYLLCNLVTGRMKARFFPLYPRDVAVDLLAALRGHLAHDDLRRYNAVQKLAYLGAIVLLIVLVLSGLAIGKSVQLPLLRELMGGFDNARIVHFLAMAGLVFFIVVHVVMVALVPRTLLVMIRGR
jgi:thiosulfate reductase cytochrome b subunit